MKIRRFIWGLAYYPAFAGRHLFQEFAVALPDDAPEPEHHPHDPFLVPVREAPAPRRSTSAPAPVAAPPRPAPTPAPTPEPPRTPPGTLTVWGIPGFAPRQKDLSREQIQALLKVPYIHRDSAIAHLGRNLYGASGVKRVSCGFLFSGARNRVRNRALARSRRARPGR